MTRNVIVGFFILAVVVCGVGFGVASAGTTDELANGGAFGFDRATHNATTLTPNVSEQTSPVYAEQSSLAEASVRDISAGMKMVDAAEAEAARKAEEENAAAVKRVEDQKAMQGVVSALDETGAPLSAHATEYSLPAVDWSMGREAFIQHWAERIDAYLEGSPLAGNGVAFAEASWDNGVDPRWSPAISNTESGKGSVCFLPCNAWGWGSRAWADWPSAIHEHVAGLAQGYGYSLTLAAARTYCPPNAAHWYEVTLAEMGRI